MGATMTFGCYWLKAPSTRLSQQGYGTFPGFTKLYGGEDKHPGVAEAWIVYVSDPKIDLEYWFRHK